VENRLREALKYDRARVQIGKISRFGLMELSRQRLQPSLEETAHINCPRCSGTGFIRGTESTALHVLRIMQEEAMKENTGAVHAQVPVDVASFLLNEKRGEIQKLEARLKVNIILVPNPHLETPHYKVQRLKHDELNAMEHVPSSYELVERPEEPKAPGAEEEAKLERQQPVVKTITPDQPAPLPQAPAPRPAPQAAPAPAVQLPQAVAAPVGFISRFLNGLFGAPPAQAPVAAPAPQPAQPQQREPRRDRDQHRRDGRRDGGGRDRGRDGGRDRGRDGGREEHRDRQQQPRLEQRPGNGQQQRGERGDRGGRGDRGDRGRPDQQQRPPRPPQQPQQPQQQGQQQPRPPAPEREPREGEDQQRRGRRGRGGRDRNRGGREERPGQQGEGRGPAAAAPSFLMKEEQLREDQRREALARSKEEPGVEETVPPPTRVDAPRVEAPRVEAPREVAEVHEPRRAEEPKLDPKVLLESAGLVMIETDRSKAPPPPAGEEPQHLGRPRRERPKSTPQDEELQQVETKR
jgi:ribonuclease E